MGEWERVFLRSLALPPHGRRRRTRSPGSAPFRCVLKSLEGAALAQGAEYQLRLSLFDTTYRHFFGKTWRSGRRAARAIPPRPARVAFNETVYFHTSLNHPGIVAVVEVVVTDGKGDEGSRHLSCGFGLIPLFGSGSEAPDSAAEDRALKLYHGTPRALLHPRFQDPVEKNKYLTVMEKSHLQYSLRPHQPLETIFHLLPENLLVSGLQTIPGLLPACGDESDCLQKPRLVKPVTCYLECLSVRLYPSLEEFEEELLDLLNSDRLLQANSAPDGDEVTVRERRLHIGVHNGLRFVRAPQVAVLVPETEAARGGCPEVPGSGARGAGQALVLRSRIHLSEMVPHPAFGVCFQLEYVFCSAGRASGKALAGSTRGEAADMRSVRWAVWSPLPGEEEVVLPLRGGAHRGPCQTLVYQTPSSGRSSRRGKHVESGTVQFRVSTDSEEHLATAAEILQKDRAESEKPPTPSLTPPPLSLESESLETGGKERLRERITISLRCHSEHEQHVCWPAGLDDAWCCGRPFLLRCQKECLDNFLQSSVGKHASIWPFGQEMPAHPAGSAAGGAAGSVPVSLTPPKPSYLKKQYFRCKHREPECFHLHSTCHEIAGVYDPGLSCAGARDEQPRINATELGAFRGTNTRAGNGLIGKLSPINGGVTVSSLTKLLSPPKCERREVGGGLSGGGVSRASPPSLSTGLPAPLRTATSRRARGVSAAGSNVPGGAPCAEGLLPVPSSAAFLAAAAERHRVSQLDPPPLGQQDVTCWARFPELFSHPKRVCGGSSGFWQPRFAKNRCPWSVLTVTHGFFLWSCRDLRRAMDALPASRLSAVGGISHLEADVGSSEPGAEAQLRALPFAPLQVPIAAVGLQAGSSRTLLSRASLARLHAAGFPEILDRNQEPVAVSEPADPGNFSPQLEEADPLQGNEIILQFLAFGRDARHSVESTWPRTIFLTFQFYRFPPVTTPRLQLVSADGEPTAGPAVPAQLLVRVNTDGTLSTRPPGLQLKYMVDPAFLRAGEQRWFVRYLAEHSLQIDVWDGDSLLLVGSAAVKLEPLLRQGRAAVRTHHELEVATMEYEEPEVPVMGREALRHGALRPLGVHVAVRGRLHLCLANVGHPCEETPGQLPSALPSRSRLMPAADGTGSVPAGSWFSPNVGERVSRARRLAEVDAELAAALCSRRPELRLTPPAASGEAAAARRRKLRRMALVRQQEEAAGRKPPQFLGWQEQRARHMRDLQIIDAYREHIKGESISRMLSQAITTTRTVHAVLGTAEFFEFTLKNPYSVQHTVTIEVNHPELSVILDVREWRHFKELTKSVTPVEEEMFHLCQDLKPQVYLRPNETVRIPFKYQTFSADPAVVAAQGPAGLDTDVAARSLGLSGAGRTKHIEVSFQVSGGKPIALLRVKVEPQPHVVDQTFRFYHPELTFLKKSIRLPPWHTLPGAPVGMPGGEPEMFVRCSDPDIICETKAMGPGEPQDVFLKVAGGPSPQIKKFFVAIYTDAWLAAPIQIWQFYLHSLQRLDVSCTTGQLARLSLLLRGTPAPRRVRAFSSHPHELEVDPSGAFLLPANGIQDLYVGVRPRRAGSRFIYLNLVDVESHQLVSSWLLCLSCRQPLVSKAFEISLPAGGGRGCNKRITYTNPYPSPRLYFLCTNRPDLLQFKEDSFEVAGGDVYTIGLRFAPSQGTGEEEILVHINDHEDKNEETFCVKVLYQ
ncbi:LOW QUALITY PROTEIN: nephrocystin-4 [Rhynochetos jubatus]